MGRFLMGRLSVRCFLNLGTYLVEGEGKGKGKEKGKGKGKGQILNLGTYLVIRSAGSIVSNPVTVWGNWIRRVVLHKNGVFSPFPL